MEKEKIPDSTQGKLSLIASGRAAAEMVPELLNATLDASDYGKALESFPEKQEYIDGLNKIVCALPPQSDDQKRSLRALRKAGGATGLLPASYLVSFSFEKDGDIANASGGFSDVWKVQNQQGVAFALKDFRVNKQNDLPKLKKRFCKEVIVAKRVQHDNVVSIVGVQMIGSKLAIVSEWLEHGDMHVYLSENTTANCVDLLLGVTKGLDYLHSVDVVHGDLKSSNILIDSLGCPRLTDFGLSSITKNANSVNASTESGRGTLRWRAPELLQLSGKQDAKTQVPVRPTKESDMYSFAMVVVEIFTGKHPFHPRDDPQVTVLIAQGSRPGKPDHVQFTSKMWSLTRKCWKQNPKKRPGIHEVLRKLQAPSGDGKERSGLLQASRVFFESRVSLHLRGGG